MRKKSIAELTRTTEGEYLKAEKLPLTVLADNVRSAQNVGAVLRTSDAFKVREVVMCGITPVPPNNDISKSALGAEHSVHWRHEEDSLEAVKRLKGEGYTICVLEQTHGSVSLDKFEAKDNRDGVGKGYVLVIGNEVKGVAQEIVDIADVALEIPMHGVKHSLNVSVSAGIALWELYKQLVQGEKEA